MSFGCFVYHLLIEESICENKARSLFFQTYILKSQFLAEDGMLFAPRLSLEVEATI
jgi:hypothetical protein